MRRPDVGDALHYGRHYAALSVLFAIVYGGSNWLTARRDARFRLDLDVEAAIPFVPGAIVVYLSIFAVFLLPLFSLERRQVTALARAFAFATVTAGILYLLLPAELAHQRSLVSGPFAWPFELLYRVALPHNLCPSLHVTYAALIFTVVARNERSLAVTTTLSAWMLALCVSVLLVRQHHLVDIAGGLALAGIGARWVYRPALRPGA